MKKNKFTDEDIRDAIILKYGSVEKYAESIGTHKQNVYDKIGRQSTKFIKELHDNGIVIGSMGANNNKGTINIGLQAEVEKLKEEIEMLKERIKDKDEIIGLLKKQN